MVRGRHDHPTGIHPMAVVPTNHLDNRSFRPQRDQSRGKGDTDAVDTNGPGCPSLRGFICTARCLSLSLSTSSAIRSPSTYQFCRKYARCIVSTGIGGRPPSFRLSGNATRSAPADNLGATPDPSRSGTARAASPSSSSYYGRREKRATSVSERLPAGAVPVFRIRPETAGFSRVP